MLRYVVLWNTKAAAVSFALIFYMCAPLTYGAQVTDITGSVAIIDRDGEAVDDRSGVVVFVDGISANLAASSANATNHLPASVSQRGGRYAPSLLPIVKGTTLEFLNDDDTFHNVFSLSKPKVFDLGIYARNTSKPVTFDRSGLVRVYCNIHPDMITNVLVLENGWFAITKADGKFSIKGIPLGDYTLRAWDDLSDVFSRNLASRGLPQTIEPIVLKQTKPVVKHKNKYGKSYKSKY